MNNLKFRAWDKKHKEMFEVIKIEYNPNIFYMAKEPAWIVIRGQNEIELMQSTGLFDKNGKEIFEGDIVSRFKNTGEEVVWNSRKGWWAIQTRGEIGLTVLAQFIEVVEIIGNIYENKELLK